MQHRLPKSLSQEHPVMPYEPTALGLYDALQAALRLHKDAVVFVEPESHGGTSAALTGGERLTLYPNKQSSAERLIIAPVGRGADERRFDVSRGIHYVYKGDDDLGGGTYTPRDDVDTAGSPNLQIYPDFEDVADTDEADFANQRFGQLIQKLGMATSEMPSESGHRIGRLIRNIIPHNS